MWDAPSNSPDIKESVIDSPLAELVFLLFGEPSASGWPSVGGLGCLRRRSRNTRCRCLWSRSGGNGDRRQRWGRYRLHLRWLLSVCWLQGAACGGCETAVPGDGRRDRLGEQCAGGCGRWLWRGLWCWASRHELAVKYDNNDILELKGSRRAWARRRGERIGTSRRLALPVTVGGIVQQTHCSRNLGR
jgi:hypothetical protein